MSGHRPWRDIRRGRFPSSWSWLHGWTKTEPGGPTVTVRYGHHEPTCPECQREKADQEARMRDDQILDVETSAD